MLLNGTVFLTFVLLLLPLRFQLLNAPENCCGLKESQILSVLSDIGMTAALFHDKEI